MLKKQNRLLVLKRREKGKIFESSLFKIKVFSAISDNPRFGFIVSKKIDKRAVVRNETKRVLKRGIKQILNKLEKGYEIVIIAKKALTFEKTKEAGEEIEKSLRKLNLIK